MTAEIVVMNKTGLAMAADSAVTFHGPGGEKIYQSVDKLFSLSDLQPIGIMVYDNAELNGVPWETVVAGYRKHASGKLFIKLAECVDHFLAYLSSLPHFFPEDVQRSLFKRIAQGYLEVAIVKPVNAAVKNRIEKGGKVTSVVVSRILSHEVRKEHAELKDTKDLDCFPKGFAKSLKKVYAKEIDSAIAEAFEKHTLSATIKNTLQSICSIFLTKQMFPNGTSGVVIAGFGEEEIFPQVVSLEVHAIILDKPRFKVLQHASISVDNTATIMPFAQTEMVHTFMEGADPTYDEVVNSYIDKLLEQLPSVILSNIPGVSHTIVQQTIAALQPAMKKMGEDFVEKRRVHRMRSNVAPVINAVAALPKDELAAMAESLVNLTSFKRRVSMAPETVGGPIDVAFISKGDGFVWVKRKQYFPPDLNPAFVSNHCFQKRRMSNE
jgi:hypothetical protein